MKAKPKKFEARLTVSLTGGDYNALNTLADKDDVSASWLVRRAVEEYLRQRNHEVVPPAAAQKPKEGRVTSKPHVRHAHREAT